jgi:serine/threonine-protein kinase HipA
MASESAQIYKKGRLAAHLFKSGNSLVFKYREDYLKLGGTPIATTLPLTDVPLALPGGTSPAYFAGLLPEGRRLNAISSRLKTSTDNDLALLLEIGQDLIGDVQVLPEGGKPELDRETLELPKDTSNLNFTEIRDKFFGLKASGIPGVQDKVSSKMLNVRSKSANNNYIVKFNPDEVPFAVENEAFFLGLAKKCGLSISKYELLTDSVGNHALRLQRFDRNATGFGATRLAVEDGCQAMNLYPSAKYDVDFVEMAQKLISLCPAKGAAGYALFKQLVFAWLTGNGDAHAKNFSILETPSNEWVISPAYDLLCTAYYNQDREMALSIDGEKSGWNRELLIKTAERLFVPQKAAVAVIDYQLKVLKDLGSEIVDQVLPYKRNENFDVSKLLKKRSRSLSI